MTEKFCSMCGKRITLWEKIKKRIFFLFHKKQKIEDYDFAFIHEECLQ